MNEVKPVGKFDHENAFQAITEVAQKDEDDNLGIADSEDLPGILILTRKKTRSPNG